MAPSDERRRPRAVIILPIVTHYRVPFLEGLREELDGRGIDLAVIHGLPEPGHVADRKEHAVVIPWGHQVENRWFCVLGTRLLWQPALGLLRPDDLVIVDQASSRLVNYALLARQLVGRQRVAFWGHGRNFQEHRASRVGEAVKRLVSRRVHWWFAYNQRAVEVVEATGYPSERITDVQNAIDTGALIEARAALPDAAIEAVRADLGITGDHVGVFIGGMYAEKRLPYLIAACDRVRELVPDFHMIFIGRGPDDHLVEAAAESRDWLHAVGARIGDDRVPYLAAARMILMPGLVGLAVLDAFAMGMPLVTTSDVDHSPEIGYLEDGVNGVVVSGDPVTPQHYAQVVAGLLRSPGRLEQLAQGARAARGRYTIDEMVRRFADGVERALR